MKALKVTFYIIDNQYDDKYDYIGYFSNIHEADKFIDENEAAGNEVIIRRCEGVMVESLDAWIIVEI